MLDAVLPHFTYRRHIARAMLNLVRGRPALRPLLDRRNWRHMQTYRQRELHCNVCEAVGRPFFDFPDLEVRRSHRIGELRETLQCATCGATMRHRVLAAAMLEILHRVTGRRHPTIRAAGPEGFGPLRILDSDSFSPIARLLRGSASYQVSSFRPKQTFDTEIEPGHYNLNLEKIGLPDASFDLVLTSDVMEHVRDDDAAHAEIARILRPGGHYVFTVPYDDTCPDEHRLVDTSGDEDRFLVPPQYHGDPLSGGILAYRVYGRSIFTRLARVGLQTEFQLINDDAALIVDGDVFIACRK